MKKADKSVIIELIAEHEMKVFYAIIGFFIWIVLAIFSLREAGAVQQSKIDAIKETVDKIYIEVTK
jgi:hypothetical protein